MLAATVLAPAQIVGVAVLCSVLRSVFDLPSPRVEELPRFVFAVLAYSGSGLFVAALMRNRSLMVQHLQRVQHEQELRRQAEGRLKLLVESSPAAILTADANGAVLASNHAAGSLFLTSSLIGKRIADYVPPLADALRLKDAPEGFRAGAQCQVLHWVGRTGEAHVARRHEQCTILIRAA